MTTNGSRRKRHSGGTIQSRKLLNSKARARAKLGSQAADHRAKNKSLFAQLPAHKLMADTQLTTTSSDFARLPVSRAEIDDLANAFGLMAVAEKAANPATNAIVMTVPKQKLHRKFPFLRLPPEMRCFIYEQVFLDIVGGAEAISLVRKSMDRAYQSVLLRGQVNALPHTCRIIRKECAPIYKKLICSANHFRICELEDLMLLKTCTAALGPLWYRSQELENLIDLWTDGQSLGPLWDEPQVTAAVCRMRAAGDIRRVVLRVEDSIRRHRWS